MLPYKTTDIKCACCGFPLTYSVDHNESIIVQLCDFCTKQSRIEVYEQGYIDGCDHEVQYDK